MFICITFKGFSCQSMFIASFDTWVKLKVSMAYKVLIYEADITTDMGNR